MNKFLNYYKCTACDEEWSDEHSAQPDDDCANCGERHISPYHSEDLEDDNFDEAAAAADAAAASEKRRAEEQAKYGAVAYAIPDNEAAIYHAMADAIARYDAAVIAHGFGPEAAAAREQINAVIWKANNYTMFGCLAPDGAGTIMGHKVKAEAGTVPQWGQPGEFLVHIDGMRCRVDYRGFNSLSVADFALHAVDWQMPFISNTGFLYLTIYKLSPGLSVSEAITLELERLRDTSLTHIHRDSQACNQKPLPSWIKKAGSFYQQVDGQMALAL